ncbi:MAG: helix-turn-helix domain-containing protein [Chlorobium sp.]|nr:helix-turn-helix domain-containing protein [Chlorobium sp.]
MKFQNANLNPKLKKYIHHISFNEFVPDNNNFIRVMPDCMTELVINFGNTYQRTRGEKNEIINVKGSHFIGIKSNYCLVKPTPKMKKVSVRFKPGAISLFTGCCSQEFCNEVVDAQLIFGKEFKVLENEICGIKDEKIIKTKIESFLLNKLNINFQALETINAVNSIYRNPFFTKVESLKNENSNYKQLERRFSRYIGLLPKSVIKIIQFNYSTKIKYEDPQISLTQLAYQSGYYDQAHFIKSFKQFSGLLPRQYHPTLSPMSHSNQLVINRQF